MTHSTQDQGPEQRYTVYVCPECGAQLYSADATCAGGVFSDRPMHEIRMAEPVEVVPASQPDPDLREALEFYADAANYEWQRDWPNGRVQGDRGEIARALLNTSGTSEEKTCPCGAPYNECNGCEPHEIPDCTGTSAPTKEGE